MSTVFLMLASLAHAVPTPSPSQTALYNAMKMRENTPDCDQLDQYSKTVADDLLWLMDNANQPPWVGIRAAQCILTHHAEAKADVIDTWVIDPDRRGLAIMVFGMLDVLPEETSVRIATKALEGPLADDAKVRIEKSERPVIQALVPVQ